VDLQQSLMTWLLVAAEETAQPIARKGSHNQHAADYIR